MRISQVAAGLRLVIAPLFLAPLLLAFATGALGADQTILGSKMQVKNPKPADASKRSVIASATEKNSPDTLVGDPTLAGSAGGAVLGVIANGGTSTARAYLLPQGTSAKGKPFWKATSNGFKYSDPKGEQGPVQGVTISRSPKGNFVIKAKLLGKNGDLDVVPPNPGTDGFLALSINNGDRYCVQFGPEGQNQNDGERLWKTQKVANQGCAMSGEFSLLNYNVAGLPDALSGSNPEVNMPLIAPLLNGYDVVLVQESWETPDPNPLAPLRVYHEILRAGSEHPYASISKTNPIGSDPSRPGAILSDGLNQFGRYPFAPVPLREPWAGCDNSAADCLALKGFSMSRMTFAPGVEVDVYNFHMEAGGNANDEALRDAGITQMLAFMAEHSAGRAIIGAGDANLHIEDEPDGTQYARLLSEGGFTDSCDAVGCSNPTRIEKTFFRSSDTVTLTALSWELENDVFVRDDAEPLSDHPALLTNFRWEAVVD